MSAIVVAGDTSGSITLQAPAVAGSNTFTLPAATGTVMVSGNMPAFSAYLSADQSGVTSSTATKIAFNTKEFDTNSNFNNTGSTVGSNPAYSFLPTVAGYYQINGTMSGGGTYTRLFISIYKNGSEFKRGSDLLVNGGYAVTASSLVYLNGSTDYISLYGWLLGTSLAFISGANNGSYFQAALVRAA